ncbi:Methyl esterase [Parasponia andersonii]|uniref:(S)-hydroxynitrile lyase n=1 Tax=Parasponia andersonii TaxID=3476 RepID=A0A2P5BYY7_PARAD|nr:Methyl esterase [Parasponia andersonii]
MGGAKHFVLVHGTCHGAWCWYKLISLLKLAGNHRVTSLDLGASGVSPKQLEEVSSVYDYVQPLMEFMALLPHDQKVILVGHSYAGLCISLAMESFPQKISVAVFLTAYLPNYNSPPGVLIQEFFKRIALESILDCQITYQEERPISVIFGPEYMRTKMYPHSKLEDLELAKLLVRPSGLFLDDFTKDGLLTEAKFGSVNRVFIVCEEDEVMKEEFQRWMIGNNPTLNEEDVMLIRGADHMVMISKPKELCQCLTNVAEKLS